MAETIIMSHTGIAYHIEHNAHGTPPFQSIHHCWVCVCRALFLSVLYSVGCLKGITFKTEWLLMDQSQKSLHQSKIPDFFTDKYCSQLPGFGGY